MRFILFLIWIFVLIQSINFATNAILFIGRMDNAQLAPKRDY